MLVGQFGHGRGEMRGTRLQSMMVAALNLSIGKVTLLFLSTLPGQINYMASVVLIWTPKFLNWSSVFNWLS